MLCSGGRFTAFCHVAPAAGVSAACLYSFLRAVPMVVYVWWGPLPPLAPPPMGIRPLRKTSRALCSGSHPFLLCVWDWVLGAPCRSCRAQPGPYHFPLTLQPKPCHRSDAPGWGPSSSHLLCWVQAQPVLRLGTSEPIRLSSLLLSVPRPPPKPPKPSCLRPSRRCTSRCSCLCFGGAYFRLWPRHPWASGHYRKLPVPYAQSLIPFCYSFGPGFSAPYAAAAGPNLDPTNSNSLCSTNRAVDQTPQAGTRPALTFYAGSGHSWSSDWAPWRPSISRRFSSAHLGPRPSLRSLRVSGPCAGARQDPVVYALVGPLSASGSSTRGRPAVTANVPCPMLRVSILSVMFRGRDLGALCCSCQALPRLSHVPLTLRPDPRRRSVAPGQVPSSSHLRCRARAQPHLWLSTSVLLRPSALLLSTPRPPPKPPLPVLRRPSRQHPSRSGASAGPALDLCCPPPTPPLFVDVPTCRGCLRRDLQAAML
ncbi:hypothetical protein NDU88_000832 [Pleurodeles waltl]|uniref:Uncharacterized protein n=1 Tax=Pleurodeles waltl TaxID=8319 RepID=A0AAV7S966_PLEWA|nr:hypothetical protein NDU88_000832 [Pleurodeles waltl]